MLALLFAIEVPEFPNVSAASCTVTLPCAPFSFPLIALQYCLNDKDIAFRLLGITPTSILFCGGPDQWAPKFHMEELHMMQRQSLIPDNIHTEYIDSVRHDFVVHPEQVGPVISFCVDRIKYGGNESGQHIRSKL